MVVRQSGTYLDDGSPQSQVVPEDRWFDLALGLIGCGQGILSSIWCIILFISTIFYFAYALLSIYKLLSLLKLYAALNAKRSLSKYNLQLIMALFDFSRVVTISLIYAFVRRLRRDKDVWCHSRPYWRSRFVLFVSLVYLVPNLFWRIDFFVHASLGTVGESLRYKVWRFDTAENIDKRLTFLRTPAFILLMTVPVVCCLFGGWVRYLREEVVAAFETRLQQSLQRQDVCPLLIPAYYNMREECDALIRKVRMPMNCLSATLLAAVGYYMIHMVQISVYKIPYFSMALPQCSILLWLTWQITELNSASEAIVDVLRRELQTREPSQGKSILVQLRTCMECDPVGWFVVENVPLRRRDFYSLAVPVCASCATLLYNSIVEH